MALSLAATALVFLFFLAAALADLHQHRERGSSAYVWHVSDRLDDLRPLLSP